MGREQSGSLEQGQSVRYEYPVPPEGLTVRLCVQQGYIVFYASFTIPNPNSALFDYKREVISLGTLNCDDVFVNPSDDNTSPVRKRQSDGGQVSVNYTLYVSLEGLSEENAFRLETSEGDNTEEGTYVCCVSWQRTAIFQLLACNMQQANSPGLWPHSSTYTYIRTCSECSSCLYFQMSPQTTWR